MNAARELFEQFKELDRIKRACESKESETDHLEFKEHWATEKKEEDARKNSRRVYAKAVCGLTNADGGIIVWGIEARWKDEEGRRAVVDAKPIKSLNQFNTLLNEWLGDLIVPVLDGVQTFMVPDPDAGEDTGYIVVYVPQASPRPRRSNVADIYYLRSGSSTMAMSHDIVQALFLARARPKLELTFTSQGYHSVRIHSAAKETIGYYLNFNLWLNSVGEVLPKNVAVMLELPNGCTARLNDDIQRARKVPIQQIAGTEVERAEIYQFKDIVKLFPGTNIEFIRIAFPLPGTGMPRPPGPIGYRIYADGFVHEGFIELSMSQFREVNWSECVGAPEIHLP